jgi:hypothetical protein
VDPPIIALGQDEMMAALVFQGTTEIGGIFTSVEVEDAATYICGYLAMKTDRYHQQLNETCLRSCDKCSSILTAKDFRFHLFVSFKEYVQSDDPHKGLK